VARREPPASGAAAPHEAGCGATQIASVLQASGFRGDVIVFRLNARRRRETGSGSAFRRNTAERVCMIEAAHNPEVAGSNPAPATGKGPGDKAFSFASPWRCCAPLQAHGRCLVIVAQEQRAKLAGEALLYSRSSSAISARLPARGVAQEITPASMSRSVRRKACRGARHGESFVRHGVPSRRTPTRHRLSSG
jgi:hypothetical protein